MIKATYRDVPVEVLDVYQRGEQRFAAIHALDNQPFVVDQWPVKARYATVEFDLLEELDSNLIPGAKPLTLLDIALTYWSKRQWSAGESIWLWRNGNQGAFLKEEAGLFVTLSVTGYRESLNVFQLIPGVWDWELCRDLELRYQLWAAGAQEKLSGSSPLRLPAIPGDQEIEK